MLRNLCTSLMVQERLITTLPKAKELRPFAERAITLGKRALAAEGPEQALHLRLTFTAAMPIARRTAATSARARRAPPASPPSISCSTRSPRATRSGPAVTRASSSSARAAAMAPRWL